MRERLGSPAARAVLQGNQDYPELAGRVEFYHAYRGTVVAAEVTGLQKNGEADGGFHGFHIHAGGRCTGTQAESFADAGGHYDPDDTVHPDHAGDLPPLLAGDGKAWMMVYTDRFYPEDVIGKTVVIHEMPDDFRTQPSGDAGAMIACGEIKAWGKGD